MKNKIIYMVISALFLIACNNTTKESNENMEKIKDSCCAKNGKNMGTEKSEKSEITCPSCGYKKTETMPTDVCVIKYNCEKCNAELRPKDGDCCVFCSYGSHKCPSMQ